MSKDLPEPGAQLPAPDPGAGSTPSASSPSSPSSAAPPPPPVPPVPPPPAPVPPPEAAAVTIEPAPDVTLAPEGTPAGRSSKGKIIAAVAAVVVLLAGVLVTVKLVSSRSADGGASSPDEAVENMIGSLEENDLLGVLDMFAPWERDAAKGLLEDYLDNAQDAGYVADDADLSNVGGYTLTVDGLEVQSTEVNERIANVALVGGTAHFTTEFDELPLGAEALAQLEEATGGEDPENVDTSGDLADLDLPPITTIEDDGRWYVSLFYTIAESARAAADAAGSHHRGRGAGGRGRLPRAGCRRDDLRRRAGGRGADDRAHPARRDGRPARLRTAVPGRARALRGWRRRLPRRRVPRRGRGRRPQGHPHPLRRRRHRRLRHHHGHLRPHRRPRVPAGRPGRERHRGRPRAARRRHRLRRGRSRPRPERPGPSRPTGARWRST